MLLEQCITCSHEFVRSFCSFDVLPLVEFVLAEGISDDEARYEPCRSPLTPHPSRLTPHASRLTPHALPLTLPPMPPGHSYTLF